MRVWPFGVCQVGSVIEGVTPNWTGLRLSGCRDFDLSAIDHRAARCRFHGGLISSLSDPTRS